MQGVIACLPQCDTLVADESYVPGMENNEKPIISNRSLSNDDRESLLGLAIGLADRSLAVSFGILTDVATETRAAVGATIDYGTALATGATRLARRISDRLLDFSDDSVRRAERAVQGVVRVVKTSSAEIVGQDFNRQSPRASA